jgi:AAA+ superfamily predicted ATPase
VTVAGSPSGGGTGEDRRSAPPRSCASELDLLVRSGWRLVALETFEEDRALRVVEQVASSSGRRLVAWSSASGLSDGGEGAGSLDAGLAAIAERPEPGLFLLLDGHVGLSDPYAVRRLRDLLPKLGKRQQAVVLVGPVLHLPLELVREAARLELPLPREEELLGLFARVKQNVNQQDPSETGLLGEAARAALGLTTSEAVRVLRKALTVGNGLTPEAVACIVREKRQALRRTPALSFHEAEAGLDDVGGLGELKRWLRERRRAFGSEARSFGLPVPRGLLLLGVQGCGKSLSAKAVAREWRFPLLRLDLATAFAGGESSPEATILEATQVAESLAPVVLWIDEIEKGFVASGHDPRASRVFGSFLVWLSEKRSPVFVVATANDVSRLPPELLRRGRFDDLFFVDLPSQAERREIFSIHLARRGRDPLQFPLEELAAEAERLSGAEIEQVVATALYTAFAESRDLGENDLANAIQETVPLYDTYEERIKELRDWARHRARPASVDGRMLDLFSRGEGSG